MRLAHETAVIYFEYQISFENAHEFVYFQWRMVPCIRKIWTNKMWKSDVLNIYLFFCSLQFISCDYFYAGRIQLK